MIVAGESEEQNKMLSEYLSHGTAITGVSGTRAGKIMIFKINNFDTSQQERVENC